MNSARWGRICLSWSWIQSFFLLWSQIVLHFVVIRSLCVHRLCCILLMSDLFVLTYWVVFCCCRSVCAHRLYYILLSYLFAVTHCYPCYEALWMWWLCELRLSRFLEMLLLLFPLILLSILITFKEACTSLRVSYNICARVVFYFCSHDSMLLSLPAIVGESWFTLAILLQGLH
jgi:hypothetical protein